MVTSNKAKTVKLENSTNYSLAISKQKFKHGIVNFKLKLDTVGHWFCLGVIADKKNYDTAYHYNDPTSYMWSKSN